MNALKLSFVLLVGLCHTSGKAQSATTLPNESMVFTRLVYHSSHCYGTCPAIDMEIDSNRNIIIRREFWKERGEKDDKMSGNFKGRLDPKTYFNLMAILIRSDYAKWKWPAEFCCDAVVTTIIIYANGKQTRLSSMFPPQEASRLIGFLYNLGTQSKFPATNEKLVIED